MLGSFMDIDDRTDWNDMQFLLALSQQGSAVLAADFLGVSHQTVSRRLGNLEKALQVRIVDRSKTPWRLTLAGGALVQQAQSMATTMSKAARLARINTTEMRGRVRITSAGLGVEHFVIPAIADIQGQYPELEFDIVVDNAPLDIQSGRFDIAVRFTKNPLGHLLGKKAGPLPFQFFGPPELISSVDRAHKSGAPEQSLKIPLVLLSTRHLRTRNWLPEFLAPDCPATHVSDITALVSGLRQGMGAGYMPQIVGRDHKHLVSSQTLPTKFPFDVWVLRNEDSRNSPRLQRISAILTDKIKDLLG
jgi:DNA-binding transcriptional LysR family regulator